MVKYPMKFNGNYLNLAAYYELHKDILLVKKNCSTFSSFAGFVQNLFLQAFTQYIFSFWTIFIKQQNQFISQY